MKKFAASIEKGLDAAQNARLLKAEIDSVFETLNEELSEVTKGKVGLKRDVFYEAPEFGAGLVNYFHREKYLGIAIVSENMPSTEIARWAQDPGGYPCKVVLPERQFYCEDKDALESVLAELLQRPEVGEVILRHLRASEPDAQGVVS
ncbi:MULTISPECIES: hypothetical protein [unclassified Herbaspirillum]|uniref:hypothetical protein n=1 Tax=unclassified Herbaspirillum TaxID=2624150 RepID=UPI000C09C42D|nr:MULTISPECIES: hypothetical protein [unclassified Herbaspirillum]MAF06074.1 hypothetical protein [Herbaspirillum sp.]MBO16773.1 hypothetical protein [Herbaspirillum sp.]|tara:strand:- start:2889 stop:3332 length:444 start_codon:yes stop_codon:yes gene_type:complete